VKPDDLDLDEDEVIHEALVKAARRALRAMNSRRQLADGVAAAVGQRVVLTREACMRDGLGHAHDELVHEITSVLGDDCHLVQCGPRQISRSHLRLAPAGAEVTCSSCRGWREQMHRMRIDAEVYRGADKLRAQVAAMQPLVAAAEAWVDNGKLEDRTVFEAVAAYRAVHSRKETT